MPTYTYECKNCKKRIEIFHGINDDYKKKCKKCSKRSWRRLIEGGAGIIFKGPGFYATDYRTGKYKDSKKNNNS